MPRLFRSTFQGLLRSYVRWERWVVIGLILLFVGSFSMLVYRFYIDNTVLIPASGGTYIEGSVGTLQPLNPWFTVQNDVNRDIVSLIFAGLLKYDPQSKKIVDDLATYDVSKDGKTYTVTLKKNIYWQDSTTKDPHPVTADDVLFTFQTIQDPDFPNTLLAQNFRGVTIKKVNDRTVQFVLDEPYSFFPSNLTLGLLPKKSFEGVPVKMIDQTLDFGFHPVGAGPYKIKSISQTELSTEVTLERFDRTIPPVERIDRLVFRIFPSYQTLLSDLHNLDGIRLVPHTANGTPAVPNQFSASNYTLPQYTALFFNLDRTVVKDQKLRLGLQLGTNKQEIAETAGESAIVDTPLLELDNSDWRYKFDPAAAQGALVDSSWYFPEKLHLQHLLEQRDANQNGILKIAPVVFLDTGALLSVTGSGHDLSGKDSINGIPLRANPTQSGSWIVQLPTTGANALHVGYNLIKLTDDKGKILDSCYVHRTVTADDYAKALNEQHLVDLFLASKAGSIPESQRISVNNLVVQDGYLRLRQPGDPIGTRINDQGKQLKLTLLTSPSPPSYKAVAEDVKKQWAKLGVNVTIDIPATTDDFQAKMLARDYDALLFGESLLDNLDSYPYWHSSGVQKVTGNKSDLRLDAYNLSQYESFQADTLLETIRSTGDETERQNALQKLKSVLAKDVPAIFLYSPVYTFAHKSSILGIDLGHLSLHSDRFLTLSDWYVKQDRVFKPGKGWLDFLPWVSSLI
ncbi:MAG TPA: ABC transporter substrate-binding protein [Candidatus Peribacteraceae bacterium]|nr:ABC transporter substrate-binding protein [Candidatus Peribacteraceae bacterium]